MEFAETRKEVKLKIRNNDRNILDYYEEVENKLLFDVDFLRKSDNRISGRSSFSD